MLDRSSILEATDFETRIVNVPEWGGDIALRGLSSADRDGFEAELAESQDLRNLRAKLVVKSAVDDDGKRLFKDRDAEALGNKNSQTICRLFDIVRELSGMSDEDLEGAQEK